MESVAESIPTGEIRRRSAAVTLWRRPLLLAFVLGCGVSMLDRLSQIFGIAGFALLAITSPRRHGTTEA